jgi:hypothetical protein
MRKVGKMKLMKFGDMHYGQWFREANGDRRFVKLQNVLPSGIKVIYRSFEIESIPEGQDARHAKPGQACSCLHFNAVDQDGIPGSCPDWLEFEIIDAPFPQRIHNHVESSHS